jgi:cell division protein FtsW (lipid II flippase)
MSLVIVGVFTFFFAGLLFSSIWAWVVLIALVLSIAITAFMNQEERIEALEKKLEDMSNRGNQDE